MPDPNEFPDFDDNLRQAFQRETELFFEQHHPRGPQRPRPADRRLHVRERAARAALRHPERLRQPVPARARSTDEARKGLLGQGSILTVTSHADRTSPVVRGKWILDNLLGTPPPPPPPDVPALKENKRRRASRVGARADGGAPGESGVRELPQLMDPLGFALENFDAVGAWRTRGRRARPIDASGQLADGTAFDGVGRAAAGAAEAAREFVDDADREAADLRAGPRARRTTTCRRSARSSATRARSDYRFSSLVLGIVESAPFQMRTKAAEQRHGRLRRP